MMEARETDLPKWCRAPLGGDEPWELDVVEMRRNGLKSKTPESREEQVTKRRSSTKIKGRVMCGNRGRGRGRGGGGVLKEFELICQQNSSP